MKWVLALAVMTVVVRSANWAVIVAGSNGYWNYRHQADTCHAYHSLIKHGVPASNIIHMAYDDIAHDSQNPFPGKVFNKPDPSGPGADVYQGCVIDYKGADVTPELFLAVITGNKAAVAGHGNGKVLESTSEDYVFINFADHGAPGLIAFPSEYLYSDKFIGALKQMHDGKTYKQMAIYIEACESGSMFENLLPADWDIYATSAANSEESSWAAYCGSDAVVNGKNLNSCLGDLYSVNWMEDFDAADSTKETLQAQFETVRTKTTQSHVLQWGDLSIASAEIGRFFGEKSTSSFLRETPKLNANDQRMVKSHDAKLEYLYTRYQSDPTAAHDLQVEIRSRFVSDQRFNKMSQFLFPGNEAYAKNALESHTTPFNFDCLRYSINYYTQTCGKIDDYANKYINFFNNICMWANSPEVHLTESIDFVCKNA